MIRNSVFFFFFFFFFFFDWIHIFISRVPAESTSLIRLTAPKPLPFVVVFGSVSFALKRFGDADDSENPFLTIQTTTLNATSSSSSTVSSCNKVVPSSFDDDDDFGGRKRGGKKGPPPPPPPRDDVNDVHVNDSIGAIIIIVSNNVRSFCSIKCRHLQTSGRDQRVWI